MGLRRMRAVAGRFGETRTEPHSTAPHRKRKSHRLITLGVFVLRLRDTVKGMRVKIKTRSHSRFPLANFISGNVLVDPREFNTIIYIMLSILAFTYATLMISPALWLLLGSVSQELEQYVTGRIINRLYEGGCKYFPVYFG